MNGLAMEAERGIRNRLHTIYGSGAGGGDFS